MPVLKLKAFTIRRPSRVVSILCFCREAESTRSPTAKTTESQLIISYFPVATGLRRPELSIHPHCIFSILRPFTVPFSCVRISIGADMNLNLIRSASDSRISILLAGISHLSRRYTMVTSLPRRHRLRAASMATFPAPTTNTFCPVLGVLPIASSFSKSVPANTPSAFSPGMSRSMSFHAPMAMYTASLSFFSLSSERFCPSFCLNLNCTPSFLISAISLRSTFSGSLYCGIPYRNTPPASSKAS